MTKGDVRNRRFAPYAVVAGVSGIAVASNLGAIAYNLAYSGKPIALFVPIVDELTSAAVWFALLPLIARAFKLPSQRRVPWLAVLPLHAAFIPIVSLTHYILTRVARAVFYALLGGGLRIEATWGGYLYDFDKDVLTYFLLGLIFIGVEKLFASRTEGRDTPSRRPAETAVVIDVRDGSQTIYLPAAQIMWVEAAGNYVELHATDGRKILMRATLASLADRLEGAGFLRIHRSRLVNPSIVSAVENMPSGDAALLLTSGSRILASRRYRPVLVDALAMRAMTRQTG